MRWIYDQPTDMHDQASEYLVDLALKVRGLTVSKKHPVATRRIDNVAFHFNDMTEEVTNNDEAIRVGASICGDLVIVPPCPKGMAPH